MAKKKIKTVFLHGFMGDSRDWDAVRLYLSDALYAVFVDLPGHGEKTKDYPRSFNALIEFLHAQFHSDGPLNLVGYSMGGRVAMAFASAYPECVSRLVLESAHPGLSDFSARKNRLRSDTVMSKRLKTEAHATFIHDWYTAPIFSSLQEKPDLLASIIERRLEQNPRSMAHVIKVMSPGRQPDCHSFLSETEIPILGIAGAEDVKYAALVRGIKGKAYELAIVENAGHTVHAEQPEQYAELLLNFLT